MELLLLLRIEFASKKKHEFDGLSLRGGDGFKKEAKAFLFAEELEFVGFEVVLVN